MTAPAVRAAVYLVFATRWIVQWTIWAIVALIGLLATSISAWITVEISSAARPGFMKRAYDI